MQLIKTNSCHHKMIMDAQFDEIKNLFETWLVWIEMINTLIYTLERDTWEKLAHVNCKGFRFESNWCLYKLPAYSIFKTNDIIRDIIFETWWNMCCQFKNCILYISLNIYILSYMHCKVNTTECQAQNIKWNYYI